MTNIEKIHINYLIEKRLNLLNNPNYQKYIGRNDRIQNFISFTNKYLNDDHIDYQIGQEFKQKLEKFRKYPMIDKSQQGIDLYNLEEELYSFCADYFQTKSNIFE